MEASKLRYPDPSPWKLGDASLLWGLTTPPLPHGAKTGLGLRDWGLGRGCCPNSNPPHTPPLHPHRLPPERPVGSSLHLSSVKRAERVMLTQQIEGGPLGSLGRAHIWLRGAEVTAGTHMALWWGEELPPRRMRSQRALLGLLWEAGTIECSQGTPGHLRGCPGDLSGGRWCPFQSQHTLVG